MRWNRGECSSVAAIQGEADVARLALAVQKPARTGLVNGIARHFNVEQSIGSQPGLQHCQCWLPEVGGEWRIEEHQIEPLTRRSRQPAQGIVVDDLHLAGPAATCQPFDLRPQ